MLLNLAGNSLLVTSNLGLNCAYTKNEKDSKERKDYPPFCVGLWKDILYFARCNKKTSMRWPVYKLSTSFFTSLRASLEHFQTNLYLFFKYSIKLKHINL